MRILVAGGAGFLGSHLVDSFRVSDNHITIVDNLTTGSRKNILHLSNEPNVDFVHHDVRHPFDWNGDLVLNLASPASPLHYQRDPITTLEVNVLGTKNLLELARRSDAIFLQASTSEVYGDPIVSPQKESYWGNVNPVGPRSCYDEGKRAAETLCMDYARKHDLDCRIVRIFNTYGPRMALNDGRVISNFIVQSLLGQDITIYGTGNQTRSFCYVDDLISGIRTLAMSEESIDQPMNLGNPHELTISEIAKLVMSLTHSRSKLIHVDLPVDDPTNRRPDIDFAESTLGWHPKIDLVDGLRRTIEYFPGLLEG